MSKRLSPSTKVYELTSSEVGQLSRIADALEEIRDLLIYQQVRAQSHGGGAGITPVGYEHYVNALTKDWETRFGSKG